MNVASSEEQTPMHIMTHIIMTHMMTQVPPRVKGAPRMRLMFVQFKRIRKEIDVDLLLLLV